jgi:hypothetical protein
MKSSLSQRVAVELLGTGFLVAAVGGSGWRGLQPVGFGRCRDETPQAEQAAEKMSCFVILSEAKNLSSI